VADLRRMELFRLEVPAYDLRNAKDRPGVPPSPSRRGLDRQHLDAEAVRQHDRLGCPVRCVGERAQRAALIAV
jgi:hypothetical protein